MLHATVKATFDGITISMYNSSLSKGPKWTRNMRQLDEDKIDFEAIQVKL